MIERITAFVLYWGEAGLIFCMISYFAFPVMLRILKDNGEEK